MTNLGFQIHQLGTNTTPSGHTYTIGAGGTQVVTISQNNIFRVCATAAINIRFGDATLTTATADDVLVPANVVEFFDMGTNLSKIAIFSTAGGNVNISIVSRQ